MSQITKNALATALKKLLSKKELSKITISNITEECGVNRQTFYYHFKDIYDLLEWIFTNEVIEEIDNEIEETVLKTAEYMNIGTERYTKRVHWLLLTGVIFWFVSSLISHTDLKNNVILDSISSFSEGAAIGLIFCVIVFTGRYGQRIRTFKQRLLKRQ